MFDVFFIAIINAISSTKRNFVLINDKIKIDSIKIIEIEDLLRSVEIDDNDKRFKDSFI